MHNLEILRIHERIERIRRSPEVQAVDTSKISLHFFHLALSSLYRRLFPRKSFSKCKRSIGELLCTIDPFVMQSGVIFERFLESKNYGLDQEHEEKMYNFLHPDTIESLARNGLSSPKGGVVATPELVGSAIALAWQSYLDTLQLRQQESEVWESQLNSIGLGELSDQSQQVRYEGAFHFCEWLLDTGALHEEFERETILELGESVWLEIWNFFFINPDRRSLESINKLAVRFSLNGEQSSGIEAQAAQFGITRSSFSEAIQTEKFRLSSPRHRMKPRLRSIFENFFL